MNGPQSDHAATVLQVLAGHAERCPNRPAMLAGRPLGYAPAVAEVRCAARGLIRAGLRVGDRVVFAVRPGSRAVIAALAVVAAGGVVVVADPGAGPVLAPLRRDLLAPGWAIAEPVVYALSSAAAQAVLRSVGTLPGASRRLAPLRQAVPDLAGVRQIVIGGPGPWAALRWSDLIRAGADADRVDGCAGLPDDPDREALIVCTSGTTQAPRAVRHTQRSLLHGARALIDRLELTEEDIVHTDQLMIGLPTLLAGATWSCAPVGADGPTWARTAAARQATVGYAVPSTLDAAAAAGPLPPSLRLVATGGAPVTPAVVQRLYSTLPEAARVMGVYGLTEALPVATVDGIDLLEHADRAGPVGGLLVGQVVPGTQVAVDADGQVWVRGGQVGSYVVEEPGSGTGPLAAPGGVATGDLARVLPDGRLVLLGRSKDMIVRGVTNIYPALVEPLVEAEPGVGAAALVGVPDPRTGDERVLLAVVVAARDGVDPAVKRLWKRLPQLIDAAWLPDDIVVVSTLPRSGRAGKVDKAALREHLVTRPVRGSRR